MSCEHCAKESQIANLFSMLSHAVDSHKLLSDEEVASTLFYFIKSRLAPKHENYYQLVGLLTDMLHFNLLEIWNELTEDEEGQE